MISLPAGVAGLRPANGVRSPAKTVLELVPALNEVIEQS